LIVTSELGCSDTLLKQIEVKEGPFTDFTFSPACDGFPVYFADKSESFLNTDLYYHWIFEPGMESNQSSPTYVFPDKGTYSVTLQTTQTVNNCSSEATKQVMVFENPTAEFTVPVFCATHSETIASESYSNQGVVNQWKWEVDSSGVYYTEAVLLQFENQGSYPIKLSIKDSNGCRDTMFANIQVNPLPVSAFTASLEKGPIPLNVSFFNQSTGAISYFWNFGDGQSSREVEPQHQYTDSGVYKVQLIAESSFGCMDSTFGYVKGIVPMVDLMVVEVNAEQTDGFLKVGMLLQNQGTMDITSTNVYYTTSYGQKVKEVVNTPIASGSAYWHDFSTQLQINSSVTLTHVCASAFPVELTDEVEANNEKCLAFEKAFKPLSPYPNPTSDNLVVEYIIPFEAKITIQIFDGSGKKKEVLYEGNSPAGFNRLKFDVSDLSSGIYIYKIEYQGTLHSYQFVIK